jgi:GTPase SAR1 family protein
MPDLDLSAPLEVSYDTRQRREQALVLLESLCTVADSDPTALGTAVADGLREGIAELRGRLTEDFKLVVIGEFKRGKSTLVNALLGAEVVSSDVTPETVVVQEIHHGQERRVFGVLEDGGQVALGAELATREALERLRERLPGPLDHLRIEDPNPFLEGIAIADTPGTGDLMWRFDKQVQSYLPKADAILYVVSALSPLSESERTFLAMTLRPMELTKVAFVVNMIDGMRSEDDVKRVSDRVAERIHRQFPDSQVFPISALDQLNRALGDEPLGVGLAERFARLERHLSESVLFNRDVVQLQNVLRDARRLLARARCDLYALIAGLDADAAALARQREELVGGDGEVAQRFRNAASRLQTVHEVVREQGETWLNGFVDRLFDDLLPQLKGMEHEVVQKHLPFFLNDALREGWTAVLESERGTLAEEVLRSASECSIMAIGDASVSDASMNASFHPPGISGTAQALVGLSFAASFLAVPALLAKGMLAAVGLAEKSKDRERAVRFREHLAESFPDLRTSLHKAHSDASNRLFAEASDALEAQFEDERTRWLATAGVALAAHSRGALEVDRCRVSANALLARCDTLEPKLEALRVG